MARASWFQRFWRWTVVFLVVCIVVDFWEFSSYLHMTAPAGSSQIVQASYEIGAAAGQYWWSFLGHVLRIFFAIAVVMLACVELVAWWSRSRRRRTLWRHHPERISERDRRRWIDG